MFASFSNRKPKGSTRFRAVFASEAEGFYAFSLRFCLARLRVLRVFASFLFRTPKGRSRKLENGGAVGSRKTVPPVFSSLLLQTPTRFRVVFASDA